MATPNVSFGWALTHSTSFWPDTPDRPKAGKSADREIEVRGTSVSWLLTMIRPAAPAALALACLAVKVRLPRRTMAILPLTASVKSPGLPRLRLPEASVTTANCLRSKAEVYLLSDSRTAWGPNWKSPSVMVAAMVVTLVFSPEATVVAPREVPGLPTVSLSGRP